ncbi:MAG: ABC transporter ATP-binding protein [Chloroflexota bacterium]|nr:ABC transporter ATP-binding protein [Chloroflexota bacterium]
MTVAAVAPAIACRGLTKRYGDVLALDGLDLEVPAGSIFGFLGPNGAGKTTTIRLLASLARATSGDGSITGVPVGDGTPNRSGLIGYLDQDPRFHGWMTARDLLDLVGRLYGMTDAERRSRITEVLELVGLSDASRRTIGGYSGGMRQRLGLAQAILNRPPVLLLDEPVSSLDPEGRVDILGVIRQLGGESTVLFSTHILTDVERVCDRVAILDRGRLVTTGPMSDLLERYAQPVYRLEPEEGQQTEVLSLVELLRAATWVLGVDDGHGALRVAVTDGADAGRQLLAAVTAQGVALLAFERQRPSLEDVFLQLVGRGARDQEAET